MDGTGRPAARKAPAIDLENFRSGVDYVTVHKCSAEQLNLDRWIELQRLLKLIKDSIGRFRGEQAPIENHGCCTGDGVPLARAHPPLSQPCSGTRLGKR